MTKADSNYETNRKKRIQKSHLTPPSMILRGFSKEFEYLGENKAKNETILKPIGQWPRPVRMMKKTGYPKSRWTVPLSA